MRGDRPQRRRRARATLLLPEQDGGAQAEELLAHHKPDRTDEALDRLAARFRAGPSIAVAAEGQVIDC